MSVGSSESVTHYLTALTAVWERENNVYVISSNPDLDTVSQTSIGNANFESPNWPGFNFIWLNSSPTDETSWGLSLYKVTNSKNPSVYFYLDTRDRKFADTTTQDFWIYYDHSESKYFYLNDFDEGEIAINTGSLLHVADIHSWTRDVSNIEDFWANSTAAVKSSANHPLVIWGKYPGFTASGYKIYNKINSGSYSLLSTVSASTYSYEHTSFDVVTSGMNSQYKIMAYKSGEESEYSNVASIQIDYPSKKWQAQNENPENFILEGNFPNPFNPTTILRFNLPFEGVVRIKIFNSLGEEVFTEMNKVFSAGLNEVLFDFSEQTSGIFYYQLTFDKQSITGKLIFNK